jgi:hypothetical protein
VQDIVAVEEAYRAAEATISAADAEKEAQWRANDEELRAKETARLQELQRDIMSAGMVRDGDGDRERTTALSYLPRLHHCSVGDGAGQHCAQRSNVAEQGKAAVPREP